MFYSSQPLKTGELECLVMSVFSSFRYARFYPYLRPNNLQALSMYDLTALSMKYCAPDIFRRITPNIRRKLAKNRHECDILSPYHLGVLLYGIFRVPLPSIVAGAGGDRPPPPRIGKFFSVVAILCEF